MFFCLIAPCIKHQEHTEGKDFVLSPVLGWCGCFTNLQAVNLHQRFLLLQIELVGDFYLQSRSVFIYRKTLYNDFFLCHLYHSTSCLYQDHFAMVIVLLLGYFCFFRFNMNTREILRSIRILTVSQNASMSCLITLLS